MNIDIALLAQAISFALLVWFVTRFVWPPLRSALDARERSIAGTLAAAARNRRELALAQKSAARLLHEARDHAAATLKNAEARAADLIAHVTAAARLEGERLLAATKTQNEHEITRARELLGTELAATVLTAAERILESELDAAAHRRLLTQFVASLEQEDPRGSAHAKLVDSVIAKL